MKNILGFCIFLFLFSCSSRERRSEDDTLIRPNILLIVVDDLGFTDLGCYGGEIPTPNIDALAKNGLLFNRFHVAPLCAPTRSMLLTGNNNHVAGMGSMFDVSNTPRQDQPGYEHHLSNRVISVAQLLKENNYETYMAGKWHLGLEDENIPHAKGFEKSYVLLDGGTNHFGYWPEGTDRAPQFRMNDLKVAFPEGGFSTTVYTDKMIEFIKNSKSDKPFFGYLAYTAPHWPLQVPEDYLHKYEGKYEMGYDSLRAVRFSRQQEMGIVPKNAVMPAKNEKIKYWNQLSNVDKKRESRKMELYAAMVDHLDMSIGRILDFLRDAEKIDNTIIIFMSDNGAAAEDFYNYSEFSEFYKKHFDNSYENMGLPTSYVSYGPQWAQAGTAPFNLFKAFPTEGGIIAPLLISGKVIKRSQGIYSNFLTVMDIFPTILEYSQTTYPEEYNGRELSPVMGESIFPFLSGANDVIHDQEYVYGLEHHGGCFLIKGRWKITNTSDPFREAAFKLFDLENDQGETNDLSKSNPEKHEEMMREWEKFKVKTGIIPLQEGENIVTNVGI